MADPSQAPKVDPEAATFFDAPSNGEGGHDLRPREPASRYAVRRLLGKGGMGAVHLCRDAFIGREVAMKVMIADRSTETPAATAHRRARFLREAAVQGQLEHPSIVPVYDVGVDVDGEIFFTMKCLRGKTLLEVLGALRRGDEETRARFSRHRLLQIFVQICQAVEFAHSRGVVHRDLKPSNVMLGDFGEVYVLDWGIARIEDANDEGEAPAVSVPDEDAQATTQAGAIVGTIGYLSPEQGRGARIDRRSDVYSLGAILFELLALVPLHDLARPQAALAATLLGDVERRPSLRTKLEVPPELDAICLYATARDPGDRHASAGELRDDVQRFLDGDRDLERRRALATEHASAATEAAARAVEGDEDARRTALEEVGRALALDPESEAAMRALVSVLSTPPKRLPADVERELESKHRERRRHTSRIVAAGTAVGAVVLSLVLLSMGLVHWEPAALASAFLLGGAAMGVVGAPRDDYRFFFVLELGLRMSAMAVLGFVLGPFVVLPSIFTLGGAVLGVVDDRPLRSIGLGFILTTMGALVVLERLGFLAAHYRFDGGALTLASSAISFKAGPTIVCLLLACLFLTVLPYVAFGRVRGRVASAERESALREWHLRQLVPAAGKR